MNKSALRWFFPGVALFMFFTLLIALLQDYIPPNLPEFLSNITGSFSFCIMLTLVLIAVRPKAIEKKLGLTQMYGIHAWMAMALPVTLLIHVGIRWSGLANVFTLSLSDTSILGYVGLISLIIVMFTGIFVLSDTLIKKSKKLMNLKKNTYKRNRHLWLHRLAIVSIIAIHFHIYNVSYLVGNIPFLFLTTLYTVIVLGWYALYKIRLAILPKYEIVRLDKPTPKIHEIELRPTKGNKLDYIAGQYGFFRFVDSKVTSEAHPFSFSSAPTYNEDTVMVMIKEDGDFTSSLDQVEVGDKVTIEGPYGNFYPEQVRHSNEPMVLLSGGIGVTPNLSLLREEIAKDSDRRIIFIWGVGYEEELMYYDELKGFAKQYPNFSHHIIFSEEEVEGFAYGFVDEDFIKEEGLEEYFETASWHVCGPPPMLEAAKGLLSDNDVTEEQANIEEFAF
ncbi:hypothetical protein HYQ40_07915 [Aerococcaceae bacterium DSM 111021]|nr:hypothetical protein [Aerococcaceae bacterium DSM 111021]